MGDSQHTPDRCVDCGTTEHLTVNESPEWADEDESEWLCDDCSAGLDPAGMD